MMLRDVCELPSFWCTSTRPKWILDVLTDAIFFQHAFLKKFFVKLSGAKVVVTLKFCLKNGKYFLHCPDK